MKVVESNEKCEDIKEKGYKYRSIVNYTWAGLKKGCDCIDKTEPQSKWKSQIFAADCKYDNCRKI